MSIVLPIRHSLDFCSCVRLGIRSTGFSHFLLLSFYIFFLWGLYHGPCGILVPLPGMEPAPLALEACSLNHWTPGKSPFFSFGTVLATVVPMSFHINFRLILSLSTKNLDEILIEIALSLYSHMRKIDIFTMLTVPTQKYGFHLFR